MPSLRNQFPSSKLSLSLLPILILNFRLAKFIHHPLDLFSWKKIEKRDFDFFFSVSFRKYCGKGILKFKRRNLLKNGRRRFYLGAFEENKLQARFNIFYFLATLSFILSFPLCFVRKTIDDSSKLTSTPTNKDFLLCC
jgi:hypothetical protein